MCDYSEYERVLKFQNMMMDFELSFKSNKTYQTILEHTDTASGISYLECIKKEFGTIYSNYKDFLIDLCSKNDKYGKAIKSNIPTFTLCSPSNIRYIYHSFLILNNISNNKLNSVDLVEIGGGYGGLCFFIHNMAKIFNIKIKSYTIFDIKEAAILQKRYLKLLDLEVNTYHIDDKWELNQNSYLISNYAFSEIPRILQEEYTTKILNNYITHGFLVWNFIPVYNFIKDKRLHIEDERPNDGSKFIYIYPA